MKAPKKTKKNNLVVVCRDERGRFCKRSWDALPSKPRKPLDIIMQGFGCMLTIFIVITLLTIALVTMGVIHW